MSQLRIVCIGAGEMFGYCVRAILKDPFVRVPAIFTWSEKVAHRMSRFILLDTFSEEMGVPLTKVDSMNGSTAIGRLKELKPDLVFVDGWSEKLSPSVLDVVKDRFICIHPSLLPKARGGATLNWALIQGEKQWGVTLFYLTDEIDRGDIIDQERFSIEERDDIVTVFDKAALAAMDLLERTIPLLRQGKAMRRKQDETQASFLSRRKPQQGEIRWEMSAHEIHRFIRGINRPYPGAFFYWQGKKVFVWNASIFSAAEGAFGTVSTVIDGRGFIVGCGQGALLVERVQLEGEPAMWADQWCRRHGVQNGVLLTKKENILV